MVVCSFFPCSTSFYKNIKKAEFFDFLSWSWVAHCPFCGLSKMTTLDRIIFRVPLTLQFIRGCRSIKSYSRPGSALVQPIPAVSSSSVIAFPPTWCCKATINLNSVWFKPNWHVRSVNQLQDPSSPKHGSPFSYPNCNWGEDDRAPL